MSVRPLVRLTQLTAVALLVLSPATAAAAPTLLGSVPIGSNTVVQLAVNTTTNQVYAAGPFAQPGLEVVNATTPSAPTLVTTIAGAAGGVAVDEAAGHFFSSDGYGNSIVTYNASSNTPIASTASAGCGGHFDFDPVRRVVDEVSQCFDNLNVVDADAPYPLIASRFLSGVGGWVRVNSNTGNAYATSNYTTTRVYGPPPAVSLLTTLPGNVIAVNPVTNRVYLAPGVGGTVTVYDGTTHAVITTIPGGTGTGSYYTAGVDTSSNRLYVIPSDNAGLILVDGATNAVTGTLTLPGGNTVLAVTVDSAKHRVYVVGGSFSGAKTLYIYSDNPAPPVANPNDQLTVQKAEQFVGLAPGQTQTVTVSCPSGHLVLDGSPLVQSVDQGTGTPADIQVVGSESTSTGAYTVTLRNPTAGNAQAKVFITCVKATTTDGSTLSLSHPPVTSTVPFGIGTTTQTLSCPSGTTAVDPGYQFTSGQGRITRSEPTTTLNGWTFTVTAAAPGTAVLSIRCLDNATSDGHTLGFTELVRTVTVPAGATVTPAITCADGSKGIVASHNLPTGVFLLGAQPQPITRLFTLQNTTSSAQDVTLDLLCLALTTFRPAPSGGGDHASHDSRDAAPVPVPAVLGPSVSVAGDGTATLKVTCHAATACRGKLALRTHARSRVLGLAAYFAPAHASVLVHVRLTRAGRALLSGHRARTLHATSSGAARTLPLKRLVRVPKRP